MKISFYEINSLFKLGINELNKLGSEEKKIARYFTNFLRLITIRQKLLEANTNLPVAEFLFLYSELEKINEIIESQIFKSRFTKLKVKLTQAITEFRKDYI